MADEHGSDPFERYFRPGGPIENDGAQPAAGADADGGEDDASAEGVTVSEVPSPRIPVGRGHRRKVGLRRAQVEDPRRQRRALVLSGVMSGCVLLTSGAAWAFESYVSGQVGRTDVAGLGGGAGDGPKGAMNILVAGVDRREGLTTEQQNQLHLGHEPGTRSDTMMLVHLSADHHKVSVISLPRDSFVLIPSHKSNGDEGPKGTLVPPRYGKLTWAYEFGGPDLTVATIKKATGLAIDHYIEVNFFGFVKMVDAIGGVDICTPQPIDDAKSGLQLPAGRSHLDGVKALGFARARYTLGDGSDLGRIDRQQKFMATMIRTALSANTLTDPIKSAGFLKATLDSLTVDSGLAKRLPALADQMKNLSTDSVTFAKIPLVNPNFRTVLWNSTQLQSTVQWNLQGAHDLFDRVKKDKPLISSPAPSSASPSPTQPAQPTQSGQPAQPTVPPEQITVRVRNGVGTVGVARGAAGDLKKVGFNTVVVPGVAQTGLATTMIEYGLARAESAKTLAASLPNAKLKEVDSLGTTIQVIVGEDWTGAQPVHVTGSGPTGTPSTESTQPTPAEAKTATDNTLCK